MSAIDSTFDDGRLESLFSRASSDEDFRNRLIKDPAAALLEEGVKLPEGVQIRLVELSATEVVLPLPPFMGDQLDIDQLEGVSGGAKAEFDIGGQLKSVLDGGAGIINAFGNWFDKLPKHQQ